MPYSGFPNTVDNGFSFAGSREAWLEDCPGLESTFVASPVQLPETLPDFEPSFLSLHSASSIYTPARDEHHPANFAAASLTPNAHTDIHGWHLPNDPHSARHNVPSSSPQYSGPTSTVMPAIPQPPATFGVGNASMHNSLQGYSYIYPPPRDELAHHSANLAAVSPTPNAHTPLHVHGWHLPTDPHSVQYNAPSFNPQYSGPMSTAMPTTHQPPVTLSSPSLPSALTSQSLVHRFLLEETPRQNPRGGRSVTSSPYRPIRTSSLPVQSVSPQETVSHICHWIRDNGTICAAPITRASVPEHLATHGITKMTHDHRVPCRWSGCRIKGNKDKMNRESMVRHVREKHLHYRRTL